jgi:hypothetical protein
MKRAPSVPEGIPVIQLFQDGFIQWNLRPRVTLGWLMRRLRRTIQQLNGKKCNGRNLNVNEARPGEVRGNRRSSAVATVVMEATTFARLAGRCSISLFLVN